MINDYICSQFTTFTLVYDVIILQQCVFDNWWWWGEMEISGGHQPTSGYGSVLAPAPVLFADKIEILGSEKSGSKGSDLTIPQIVELPRP